MPRSRTISSSALRRAEENIVTNQHTKSKRKAANIALFKAVRSSDVNGVRAAKEAGADLRFVSRGLTAIERAMRDFPRSWDASVVAYLMEVGEAIPEMNDGDRDLFVLGLALAGEEKALASVLDSCMYEGERWRLVLYIRMVLVNQPTVNPNAVRHVAPLAWFEDEVEGRAGNLATWLHVAVCGTAGTPLEYVMRGTFGNENTALLEYILAFRPKVDSLWFGFTPLHLAAHMGRDASFDMLLDAGADVDLPDGNEEVLHSEYHHITPHQWARVEAVRFKKQLQTLPQAPLAGTTRRGRL
jgi:hypothetical protein